MTLAFSIFPLLLLLVALTVFKVKAWQATLLSLVTSLCITLFYFSSALPPTEIPRAIYSASIFALCPICLVVLSALFTYGVTVESGAMERLREGLRASTDDKRILALIVVWGFGNFMEGIAGFGTAVAIPAAIMLSVGFDPLKAVLACLVANTTSTTFGSVGVPIVTLSDVSQCGLIPLMRMASLLQLMLTALGPVLVLLVLGGPKACKGMFKAVIIADVAYLVPWVFSAQYLGCELPDILGGIGVMSALTVYSKNKCAQSQGFKKLAFAWLPFSLVVIGLAIYAFLPSIFKSVLPSGLVILFAAFIGGLFQRVAFGKLLILLVKTAYKYLPAFATIVFVLMLAKIMSESGMISVIAASIVDATGRGYAFVAPLVGALGGFLTGSGTSSCVLFGRLQADVAAAIGSSQELLSAANIMGAGIGKMICPQSIAIGAAAAGISGYESVIFKKIFIWFFFSVIFSCVTCAVVDMAMRNLINT